MCYYASLFILDTRGPVSISIPGTNSSMFAFREILSFHNILLPDRLEFLSPVLPCLPLFSSYYLSYLIYFAGRVRVRIRCGGLWLLFVPFG